MNDEPEFPNGESVPSAAQPNLGSSSAAPTPVENTRPLPPYQQPAPERATAPARRGVVSAGLLAGALLVGGAAGVGGAAWYDAWQGDGSSNSASTAIDTGSGASAVGASCVRAVGTTAGIFNREEARAFIRDHELTVEPF